MDAIASIHEKSETPMMTITYAVIRLREGDEIQTADDYNDVVAQLRDLGVMKVLTEATPSSSET